ncbi:cytochrome c oxidase assembly protein [Psychrosphaera aestuarii]|uniref:cytochrome c oxidase assembly protein n=1 Tax=Psychrosphaera aestuarii TaxID=1266052 RepID=UPI001B332DF2|nr:cytochrome c oxidase assembly protein [Psychrosphaera aestuarii]
MSVNEANKTAQTKLIKKLVLTVVFMFGFGFALVPLYDVFCDITGLNGKTSNQAATQSTVIDMNRTVTVEFIAHTQGNLPWTFKPEVKRIKVHPGEQHEVNFLVSNQSAGDMVVQAIPSVSPGLAATYFNKIECFCFNHQPLEQGQQASLGLQFYIDPELPPEYSTVTLSYTLFDISDKLEPSAFADLFADSE